MVLFYHCRNTHGASQIQIYVCFHAQIHVFMWSWLNSPYKTLFLSVLAIEGSHNILKSHESHMKCITNSSELRIRGTSGVVLVKYCPHNDNAVKIATWFWDYHDKVSSTKYVIFKQYGIVLQTSWCVLICGGKANYSYLLRLSLTMKHLVTHI